MDLTRLRCLLKQAHSHATCIAVLEETARLYREDDSRRWFFLLLNRVFAQIIDNPELHDPETAEPVLETIFVQALLGTDSRSVEELRDCDKPITEAYCGLR